jgi:hypothetical protein
VICVWHGLFLNVTTDASTHVLNVRNLLLHWQVALVLNGISFFKPIF